MDQKSPPDSPVRKAIEYFHNNYIEPKLENEWQNRAEEELNETSVRRKQELLALRILIASKRNKYLRQSEFLNHFFLPSAPEDFNVDVPEDDEFLLRFLRARKFDSKKAFEMV